jgi:hypothetical protein
MGYQIPELPAGSFGRVPSVPVAVSWVDFFFGVGVTVVGGIVLAIIVGGGRSLLTRNQRAQQADAEAYARRTPARAGFAAVASELRWNADIAERCEHGHEHVPSAVANLRVDEWYARREEMTPLRDEDPKLWWSIERMYDALRLSKQSGGYPPNSADIRRLIEEVDLRAD